MTSYTYDRVNRLQTVTEPGRRQTAYTYDKTGNRLTETVADGRNTTETTYGYNELNQLKTVKTNGKTISYRYNGEGLRVEKQADGPKFILSTQQLKTKFLKSAPITEPAKAS